MLYEKYKYISSMKRFMRGSEIQERIIDNNYKTKEDKTGKLKSKAFKEFKYIYLFFYGAY